MDRNIAKTKSSTWVHESPSARRAWIEISWDAPFTSRQHVALRKEGVDRNLAMQGFLIVFRVALRKEGVDRNRSRFYGCVCCSPSPSARRAWIEITWHGAAQACHHVALRKEGVDRNRCDMTRPMPVYSVALRKEGVDRNLSRNSPAFAFSSRPPQGGRG